MWEVITRELYVDEVCQSVSAQANVHDALRYHFGASIRFPAAANDAAGIAGMSMGRSTLSDVVKTSRTTMNLSIALVRNRSSTDEIQDIVSRRALKLSCTKGLNGGNKAVACEMF